MAKTPQHTKITATPAEKPGAASEESALQYGSAIAFWLVLWFIVAALVGNPILLASPIEMLQAFWANLFLPDFWGAVALTSARIVGVGIAGACLGTSLGMLAARWHGVNVFLGPLLQVMKSAPVACIIVIMLVITGAVGALISIVAFVTIPPFYFAAIEAQKAREYETERVLRLAGVREIAIFFASTWPCMRPFFCIGAKTAIAFSWKAGITAELLCVPFGSIGEAVYGAKLTLDTPALLMWTVVVMLLGWATEKLLLSIINSTKKSPQWALKRARSEQVALPRVVKHCDIELENVFFGYTKDQLVLSDVSMRISPNQRVCLMAPTGTGKTTLLGLLLGALEPHKGKIRRSERLGVVLQENTLVESLTAIENVQLVCGNTVSHETIEAELAGLLPAHTEGKAASELSGGTKRLTEIARALFSPAEAIILDEPFVGLDEETSLRACDFILKHLNGRPLLFTSHHSEDAVHLHAEIIHL